MSASLLATWREWRAFIAAYGTLVLAGAVAGGARGAGAVLGLGVAGVLISRLAP